MILFLCIFVLVLIMFLMCLSILYVIIVRCDGIEEMMEELFKKYHKLDDKDKEEEE